MIVATRADIAWDSKKKDWIVSVHVGEEVIKRSLDHTLAHDVPDDVLRTKAVATAKDDGYGVPLESVDIVR